MVRRSRKPAFVLTMIAFSMGVLGVGMLRSGARASESTKAELGPGPGQSSQSEGQTASFFGGDPNFAGESSFGIGGPEFFVRTMLGAVFVIVLGVAALYVSRKLLPKLANRPGKEIRIVETAHLGPRRAVHLVEVGHRRFLIGSTNENIRKLAEVTAGFPDVSEQDIDLSTERT